MNSIANLNDTKFLLLDDESLINKSTNSLLLRLNNTQLLLNEDQSFASPQNPLHPKSINEILPEDNTTQILKAQNNLLNDISSSNINIPINYSNNNNNNLSLSTTNFNFQQNIPEPNLQTTNISEINFGLVFPTEQQFLSYQIINTSPNEICIEYKITDKENINEYFDNNTQINISNANILFKQNIFEVFAPGKHTLLQNETLDININVNAPLSLKHKVKLFSLLEIYHNGILYKTIPLIAEVEIPKFTCMKSISNDSFTLSKGINPLLPVKIEITSKGQKYRIPFKNFSMKEMILNFNVNKKGCNYFIGEGNVVYKLNIFFFPNRLTLMPQSVSYVDMILKICREVNDENVEMLNKQSTTLKMKRIRKVINVQIENTSIVYKMFVDGYISGKSNSNSN